MTTKNHRSTLFQSARTQAYGQPEREPTGALHLSIEEVYSRKWQCAPRDYDLGDIVGSGDSLEEAAADFAEQFADHEVVAALSEAHAEISALGDKLSPETVLAVLVKLGAKPKR